MSRDLGQLRDARGADVGVPARGEDHTGRRLVADRTVRACKYGEIGIDTAMDPRLDAWPGLAFARYTAGRWRDGTPSHVWDPSH